MMTLAELEDLAVEFRVANPHRSSILPAAALKKLREMVSWHKVSGTLPDALWRSGYCRPADSVELAVQFYRVTR